ncbi:phosphatase PAP2 family protein [Dyella amyloliquefaciens]|uniref:phosphatase PAP2 family protein n=1 Tax=Dyella amyloliquefaciens TaxID=1770545 RepID=UPI00102ECE95|nr:phosphatase PAP2 family protein [Dyella amyloliquefaciens]
MSGLPLLASAQLAIAADAAIRPNANRRPERYGYLIMHGWTFITAFGDSAVLLPCAVAIFFWLGLSQGGWSLAWRWLLLFCAVALLVAASKLMFMAWRLGIPSLDFMGISGHSAMSATVWTALLALLWPRSRDNSGAVGAMTGLLFAIAIAVSRVAVHAHSWAEVLAGLSLGGGAVIAFLWWAGPRWQLQGSRWLAVLTLVLILSLTYGHRFPSEYLLRVVAKHLSLDSTVYTRRSLHELRE